MKRWLVVACWLSGIGASLQAEDRVTLIPSGAVDPVIVIGTVEDYTGEEMILQREGQPVGDRYPARSIQAVQTWRSATHEQGLVEFNAGTNAPAEQSLLKAMQEESRDWIKREILALLVRCAIRRGDWSTAGDRFLQIVQQDPTSPHWNVAPLVWAPQSLGDSQKTEARTWLKDTHAPPRVLAASWLLFDPIYGESAKKQLNDLARDSNHIVSSLARAQLWRLRLGLDLSDLDIQKWQHEVRLFPKTLRAGPQYLIGRGLLQRNEPGPAAAELLWLSTVYIDNEDLSARALVEAAGALSQAGRSQDALTLYREVLQRYAWSPWAHEARSARSVLSSPGRSGENGKR